MWPGTCYITDILELLGLLLLPPKWWNYKFAPPHVVYALLGLKPRVLWLLAKYSDSYAIINPICLKLVSLWMAQSSSVCFLYKMVLDKSKISNLNLFIDPSTTIYWKGCLFSPVFILGAYVKNQMTIDIRMLFPAFQFCSILLYVLFLLGTFVIVCLFYAYQCSWIFFFLQTIPKYQAATSKITSSEA